VTYDLSQDDIDLLQNNFTYHPPTGSDQIERYADLRFLGRKLAEQILQCCPPSRERNLAIINLEQAIMWANASIARNEKQVKPNSNE
jgi:hypothetical protein